MYLIIMIFFPFLHFAVAEFSTDCKISIPFNNFRDISEIDNIKQQHGMTYNGKAINKLVNELFTSSAGARPNANRVLLIITDGESNDGGNRLMVAIENAEKKKITRYVGRAFHSQSAQKELRIIASQPHNEHIFKVDNYDLLDKIRGTLEEQIIAIEGMSVMFIFLSMSSLETTKHGPWIIKLSEVCVVDLNAHSYMDLLLVSAPLYMEDDQEGKIFVYSFSQQTLEGMMGQKGRFGSALASPGDLNEDYLVDVVVGAPLEDDGQGSIYIFNGRATDINPTYSQRISGSSVHAGLRLFGLSLSEFALDHSGDGLPDIAVGSKGAVTLLRSRPIVSLVTKVSYSPSKIPTKDTDCEKPLENILHLCFTMKDKHTYPDLSANIKYTIKLDGKRQNYQVFFSVKNLTVSDSMTVTLEEVCTEHSFFIEVRSMLSHGFSLYGQTFSNTLNHLDFEINCGDDKICTDNLKMDFNFSGLSDIKVGIMQDMNVTVFVENRGENSYNSLITVSYPFGLSFRRFTTKQGRVECISLDSDDKGSLGSSMCHISKPIFRENGLMISYMCPYSGNDKHSDYSELFKNRTIGVKYGIYISLIRYEKSSIHINFTAGKNNLEKPASQILKVQNDLRDLTLTILIKVPITLGDKDIWTTKDFSGWIEQTGLRSAVFELVSTATLEYDKNKYVYFSSDSLHTINTQVEVYEEKNIVKEIIGGTVAGLLILALITAGLYKAGFFKSRYKQTLEGASSGADGTE
uniref:VWFA domain-containing protein n=1 Tax=Electrophorus electricus TaxID=8005 RepID=A0AAY5ECL8_ELEEL